MVISVERKSKNHKILSHISILSITMVEIKLPRTPIASSIVSMISITFVVQMVCIVTSLQITQ